MDNTKKHSKKSLKAPFEKFLGMEIIKAQAGSSLVKLSFRNNFTNPHASLHGGAIVSLADTASAVALSGYNNTDNFFTTKFNIEFKKQAKTDIFAQAEVVSKKKHFYFIDINISDTSKEVIAKAKAVFFAPPASNNAKGHC